MQVRRFGTVEGRRPINADAEVSELETLMLLDEDARQLLLQATEKMQLSARAYHRAIKTARTIADLDCDDSIKRIHMAEALSYRQRMVTPAHLKPSFVVA